MGELELNAACKPRLLVFVVAYHAESTLRRVLERIPRTLLRELEGEVLVIDDASSDRTFEVGREYRDRHPELRLTVLRNQVNQGYGGNQKVGYAYAIAHGFDYVAMVHGDGQYAPEALPMLAAPLLEGRADAVFGSRMLTPGGALRGGMPLYKFVGNRLLTACQNALLGTHLSEFHSGYRLYAVAALERIPLRLNSNDFSFDTEIIIQLSNAKQRIVELPIPTHYGDEVCRVNGLQYAKDVLLATLKNTLHRTGLGYQRRYDPAEASQRRPRERHRLSHANGRSYALARVPNGANVLDVGGSRCESARELLARGCQVTVLDRTVPPAGALSNVDTRHLSIHVQDLELAPQLEIDQDYILMLDILERLRSPERFLERLRKGLDPKPHTLILTTPNVAFCAVRGMLLLGQFNYAQHGILDHAHRRLFTVRSLTQLLSESGFRVRELRGMPAPLPKRLREERFATLAGLVRRCNQAAIALHKGLFAYQLCVVAETVPDIDHVVRAAARGSRLERARAFSPPR